MLKSLTTIIRFQLIGNRLIQEIDRNSQTVGTAAPRRGGAGAQCVHRFPARVRRQLEFDSASLFRSLLEVRLAFKIECVWRAGGCEEWWLLPLSLRLRLASRHRLTGDFLEEGGQLVRREINLVRYE